MNSRLCRTASAVPRYRSRARPRPMKAGAGRRHHGCGRGPVACRPRYGRSTSVGRTLVRTATWVEPRVDRIRESEVDDPVLPAEWNTGLGTDLGQDREPLTLSAGQDQSQDRLRHAVILALAQESRRRRSRQRRSDRARAASGTVPRIASEAGVGTGPVGWIGGRSWRAPSGFHAGGYRPRACLARIRHHRHHQLDYRGAGAGRHMARIGPESARQIHLCPHSAI